VVLTTAQPINAIQPPPQQEVVEIAQPQHTTCAHQITHITNNNNQHWGDPIITPKPLTTFQILTRNVNTLSYQSDYLHWKAVAHTKKHSKTDTVSLHETNLAWHKKC